MVAHEKRNPAQLFCAVPTQNDLALSSLLFSAHPTQKLGYPGFSQLSGGKCEKQPGKPPVGCIFCTACYNDSEVITLDKQTFGTFVAEQRKRQGLTQRQLAQLLHVTDKAVSKWERGLSYPDVTLLQPLAAALYLDTDRLLTCRHEESEEHMTQITPPLPPAEASPAVQAVLDISDANSRLRRKRQRLAAAAAVLAIAVIAVLAAMQYNGALFISRRIVTPDGVTMSLYRDALIGGRFRMEADAPLSMAGTPCSFCGQSEAHDVTRLALDSRLTTLDTLEWSADGRYLLLSGSTRGASAWLEVWTFPADGADTGIMRQDAADILLQLSGHQDESAPTAPLLPALPGVSAHTYMPRVALSDPHWLAGGQLELSYAYDGTDGVRRSGTLVYDAVRGIVRSVSGSIYG